jgi:oxygen-independent coproporphyrinogen-3 oxidase
MHRCHYCDFNTYESREGLHGPYVDALVADIRWWPETSAAIGRSVAGPATSVFFGGGTPTLLPAARLAEVLDAVKEVVGVAAGAEVTVEANPETVDDPYFEALVEAGFNRVSIGVQSLSGHVLSGLRRTHDAAAALEAMAAARKAGVSDVNADLIYGSPWETAEDWVASLEGVIEAGPDHVSAYALTVEEGTPLATLVRTGRVPDVDADVQADRHAIAEVLLGSAGYARYEVSNWAKPGRASAHNVLYWSAGNYLGFGAGAHAHVGGRRWWSTRLPRDFMSAVAAGRSVEAGHEILERDERAGEALMLGLRLAGGVDTRAFAARFGPESLEGRARAIVDLEAAGMLEAPGGQLRLAPGATFVANEAVCRLL